MVRRFSAMTARQQDWGFTYDELEPFYDRFEKTAGIAGKAGNLRGKRFRAGIRSKVRARTNTRSRR